MPPRVAAKLGHYVYLHVDLGDDCVFFVGNGKGHVPITNDLCKAVHDVVSALPRVTYPFDRRDLPRDAIYFFFEAGERDGHTDYERIVRVGTHKNGNFRSRISEHFLLGKELGIQPDRPAPKDRSIFRKNLGRAWICKQGVDYLDVWNIDFTSSAKRREHGHRRDTAIEHTIESNVTALLRGGFSFAWVPVAEEADRMGTGGLEGRLIGTLAQCTACRSSDGWLGHHSPDERIRTFGLWQVQHLQHDPVDDADLEVLRRPSG